MQAAFALALERHPGSVHFGQAVGVIDINAQGGFDLPPGFFRVRLGADERFAQHQVFSRINPLFLQEIREVKRVAGQDVDHRGAKVLHEHQLAFRGPRPGWDHQAAKFLRPVVHDQTAREQPVTHHVLEHVAPGDAGHAKGAGDQFR